MSVLVTGATGFIGRQLVMRLSATHQTIALVRRRESSGLEERTRIVTVDLERQLDVGVLPSGIDVIVHLAQANVPFPGSAKTLFAVNTLSTSQLLDYGRQVGARRFILASSGDVYGYSKGPSRESDPVKPVGFYAVTKYASELLVQSYSDYMETCILRLYHPYGPGQNERLIPNMVSRIRSGKAILLYRDDSPRFSPMYIDDILIAFQRAILSTYSGVLNVAGDCVVTVRELAEAIAAVLGKDPVFDEIDQVHGDLAGDNSLMKSVLGTWPMVTLKEGLFRTLNSREAAAW